MRLIATEERNQPCFICGKSPVKYYITLSDIRQTIRDDRLIEVPYCNRCALGKTSIKFGGQE